MKILILGFVAVLLFVHMYRYYMKLNSKDIECDDRLNVKLFDIDIPVCLWNIAHVITFVILSHVISARSLYDHTKLLLVGIISKPRYDDIFFNTFGQIIYIISKLPMK